MSSPMEATEPIFELLIQIEQRVADIAAQSKLRLYSTRAAAEYCGMNYGTFRNRLAAGTGPRQNKEGDSNAFYEADLDAWNRARLTPVEAVAS